MSMAKIKKTAIWKTIPRKFGKSKKSKKIVILELMILVHIDDKFDKKEHELTKKIVDSFKINDKDLKYFSFWGKAVSSLYEQGKLFIED